MIAEEFGFTMGQIKGLIEQFYEKKKNPEKPTQV
jgi:hypothetical protein